MKTISKRIPAPQTGSSSFEARPVPADFQKSLRTEKSTGKISHRCLFFCFFLAGFQKHAILWKSIGNFLRIPQKAICFLTDFHFRHCFWKSIGKILLLHRNPGLFLRFFQISRSPWKNSGNLLPFRPLSIFFQQISIHHPSSGKI